MRTLTTAILFSIAGQIAIAQDSLMLASAHRSADDVLAEQDHLLDRYDALNSVIGGDSIRHCGAQPCSGWIEDTYQDGTLKHKGYYEGGRLMIYKNFHPNGDLEREFRSPDVRKSFMRQYYRKDLLRSETRFIEGVSVEYKDFYPNGQLRYHEERHAKEPYYLRMDLYAADGTPISLLQLVDKKKVEFELKEYHPGGILKSTGRARYNRARMDSQRIGTWITYAPDGSVEKEEQYVDGKVHR
jgi:antitoxin component YwqK of YwqJK toxin-antitoxin module